MLLNARHLATRLDDDISSKVHSEYMEIGKTSLSRTESLSSLRGVLADVLMGNGVHRTSTVDAREF